MYYVIASDGTVAGPYDAEAIGRWLAEGRLGGASLVSGGSQSAWVPLAEHPDLASLVTPSPAPAPGPATRPARGPRSRSPRAPRSARSARTIALAAAALAALAVLVAVALALTPLVPSGRWSLAPDVAASWLRGTDGATPHPLAAKRSDAPAVDATPLPGIRIQAPAGALDKQRTFTARQLDAPTMVSADEALRQQGLVLLGGYDLDAGMAEKDRFVSPATMTWDLEKLGVPQVLWDKVGVANISAHGQVDLVASRQHGSNLVFETSHNGVWTIILLPILVGSANALWVKDHADVPQGDFASVYWSPGDKRFRVMYPRGWPSRDPAAVQAAEDEYRRLVAKHKLSPADVKAAADAAAQPAAPKTPPSTGAPTAADLKAIGDGIAQGMDPFSDLKKVGDQLAKRLNQLAELANDPEYKTFEEKVKSEKFLTEAYLPVRVTNNLIALDRAYAYLGERGFRKPGIAKFPTVTDIFIVGTSMGTDAYGEERNGFTTSPFIVFDGTKLPDAPIGSMTPEQKAAFDQTQLSAVHELFHVVQAAYVLMDRNTYLWFNEATAVAIEGEAKEYYVDEKHYADKWETTLNSYSVFFDAMEFFVPDESKPNQVHGYGESNFVAFLRDFYYTSPGGKKSFMPTLFDDYSRVTGGGPLESLYRITGGTPKSLSEAFYSFSYAHRDDLMTAYNGQADGSPKKPTATIDVRNPVYVWRFAEKGEPLSAQILRVDLAGGSGKGAAAAGASAPVSAADAPVFVLSTNGTDRFGAVTRAEAARGIKPWSEVRGGAVLDSARQRQHLMRVETYLATPAELKDPDGARDNQGPIVFGMFKDTTPPTVTVKDQTVHIRWKPSGEAALVNSAGKRQLIDHFRVTITTSDGRQTFFSADKPDMELPVAMLDKLVAASGQANRNKLFTALHGIGQADMITLMNMSEALSGSGRPKLAVSYQEVAAIPGAPLGPMSAIATFEIGDEARTAGDVTGTWLGRVPFTNGELMRLDLQQELGGNLIGTMHFQGESVPIQGAWQPTTSGWQLEIRDGTLWQPMFLLAPGYAQKLPADKIYLTAPPALLTRVDKKRPELGWSRKPEDMQWQDFINMLGSNIKQFNKEMETRQ